MITVLILFPIASLSHESLVEELDPPGSIVLNKGMILNFNGS